MMTIFSMLFGAGLVLMDQRAEKRGAKIRGVYYRRVLWLLVIGLIHSYLIWWGDILVLYAECGLFLYFFRNLRPRTLIILGLSAMLVLVPLVLGFAQGHRLHEGRDGPVRGPDQGRREAPRRRPHAARLLDRESPGRDSRPAPRRRPRIGIKRWPSIAAAIWGSSSIGPPSS